MPADLVKIIIHGTLTFTLKVQHAPDLSTVCDSLNILQTEAKASSDNTAQMLEAVKHELKNELKNTADTINAIAANVQLNMSAGEAAKTAAKEAVEVGKANLQMARQIKNAGPQTGGTLSYAAMVARGAPPASITNAQVTRMPLMQTQREVVVTIRDPTTVLSLRAMNLRNLNAHIERAIAQSRNENISGIKVLSSNQLRSGDLSIKTATSNETEALKQFADDWVNRVDNRALIRIMSEGLALSLASSLSQHRLWLVVCYLQLDCLLVGSSIYTVSVGAYSQYITTYLTTHHLRCYCAHYRYTCVVHFLVRWFCGGTCTVQPLGVMYSEVQCLTCGFPMC